MLLLYIFFFFLKKNGVYFFGLLYILRFGMLVFGGVGWFWAFDVWVLWLPAFNRLQPFSGKMSTSQTEHRFGKG